MRLKGLILTAAMTAGLSANAALAHSQAEVTTPANGAVLDTAPETITLRFDNPIRVTLLTLTDGRGESLALDRSEGMAAVTELVAVPEALMPGEYTVQWRGLSGDGHPMQGEISFEIAP